MNVMRTGALQMEDWEAEHIAILLALRVEDRQKILVMAQTLALKDRQRDVRQRGDPQRSNRA